MIPGSANPLLLATAAPTGYNIERSIRLNSADSAFLSRTPASAGNRKTWTWAGWVKRSALGTQEGLFSAGTSLTNDASFGFSAGIIECFNRESSTINMRLQTTPVFRDFSAWYHIVFVWNTTSATASDRSQIWVNGVRITAFNLATYPGQNTDSIINNNVVTYIGTQTLANYSNSYLADIHFIDGQALTPSSFGEFDTNNVWQPKAYTGSYGTNGFQLKFADNSAATAAALGKDTSGNGHNWTPTNLSVTAGAGNDSLVDSPTNYGIDTGVGAEVRGNYCTLNPLAGTGTKANGNLEVTGSGCFSTATISPPSGKWYWEVTAGTISGDVWFGIYGNPNTVSSYVLWGTAGSASTAGGTASFSSNTIVAGDIIGCAWNMDTSTLQFYRNGSSVGTWSGFTLTGSWHPGIHLFGGTASSPYIFNFGQRPFAYTAPSGFKALCTASLPTPTIANPATAMDVVLYTGTGATLTPTSTLGFSPDLVWIKSRSAATDNTLYDSVRGAQARLESNTTDAEVTSDNGLTAFNSNGFTLGTLAQVNTNAATYAGWAWDAGSSTVTNTSGTISSQVRANPSAGFSVATFTAASGQSYTVGHGLNVAPQMTIIKSRNQGSGNWFVWHIGLGDNTTDFLTLNGTAAESSQASMWGSVGRNSTVCGFASQVSTFNNDPTVMYNFAPVAGYSAFGTYTGNNSADGPFVFCNFRPRWVMIKASSGSGTHWILIDSTRSNYNQTFNQLYANLANAEDVNNSALDLLSNGFKCRADTFNNINASGVTYIYAAFAEHPFSASRAR